VIDDYVRNFMASRGLKKSLEAFQNEWYEVLQKQQLSGEDSLLVPDVYQQNQELSDALKRLRLDSESFRNVAAKTRGMFEKLRKERDFHKMHHKRVVQEKNKLIEEIKKLKLHFETYEPTLRQLRQKYEIAMKDKMLTKLDRDKLAARVKEFKLDCKHGSQIERAGGIKKPSAKTKKWFR
jgi:hypothetical protein